MRKPKILKKFRCHSFIYLRWLYIISSNENPVNALNPYNAMKLYVYIFKRLDLKRFEIFKNIPSNCRPQFSDFFSKISAILLSTDSHIKCIVCICVSFLYICLTSETLHYPWTLVFVLPLVTLLNLEVKF